MKSTKLKLKQRISKVGSICTIGCVLLMSSIANANSLVYVQASKGSFNDAAITQLFSQQPELKTAVEFAGTPLNTFKLADENNQLAFAAVANSTIKGHLVQATVKALQVYDITEVEALISTPIEMCVLMNTNDVKNKQKIKLIASHPAALKQINKWKTPLKVKEIAVPAGTAAIGSCVLESTYPNLIVVAKGVQDNKNNNTSFLLVKVKKRDTLLAEEDARAELAAIIEKENM